jgi:hypothetical protein
MDPRKERVRELCVRPEFSQLEPSSKTVKTKSQKAGCTEWFFPYSHEGDSLLADLTATLSKLAQIH